MDTLAFGCILPATGQIRDFHPLERALAGRTKQRRHIVSMRRLFLAEDTGPEPPGLLVLLHLRVLPRFQPTIVSLFS